MTDLDALESVAKRAPMPATFNVRWVKKRDLDALIRVRGIQPICARCANDCAVLLGSPGREQKFECFIFTAKEGVE